MEWVPFLLLGGALAVFLVSTRQFPLGWRALVWIVGAALLTGAIWVAASAHDHFGLFRAAENAWAHRDSLVDSAIYQGQRRNCIRIRRR
jgi:hypothetical protein